MKTNDYIKKYNLGNPKVNGFNYNGFTADLASEFITKLELHKERVSEFLWIHYEQVVDEMDQKFEAIQRASLVDIPDFLWDNLFNKVIYPLRFKTFPVLITYQNTINNYSIEELIGVIKDKYNKYIFIDNSHGIKSALNYIQGIYDTMPNHSYYDLMLLKAGIRQLKYALKTTSEKEKKKQARDRKRYRSWFEDFLGDAYSNYYFFKQLIGNAFKPTNEFNLLGLNLEDEPSVDDIKAAYRKLALEHHPDRGGNQEEFISITEAKNKCIAYLTK